MKTFQEFQTHKRSSFLGGNCNICSSEEGRSLRERNDYTKPLKAGKTTVHCQVQVLGHKGDQKQLRPETFCSEKQ